MRRAPLDSLVQDYADHLLRVKRRNPKHVRQTAKMVRRVLASAKADTLPQATTARLARALDTVERGLGLSPQHVNNHITAVRAFFRFLVSTERWGEDPTAGRRSRAARDVKPSDRRERDAFTPAELGRLLMAASQATKSGAAIPGYRRHTYLVVLQTGMRYGEAKALRWADVDLLGGMIRLPGTKAGTVAHLELSPAALDALQDVYDLQVEAFGGVADDDLVLRRDRRRSGVGGARGIYLDMERARIPRERANGMRLDFHSLRTSYVSNLARARVPLAQAQRLARHSRPELTSNVYSRFSSEENQAVGVALDGLLGLGT